MCTEDKNPSEEALRAQLGELNNRSRWYSTQLWTVPLTFFGISSIIITSFLKNPNELLWLAFLSCALLGIFVIWHLNRIADGEQRAVTNLQKIEGELGLFQTAENKPYANPFKFAVNIFVAILFITSAYLAWHEVLKCA